MQCLTIVGRTECSAVRDMRHIFVCGIMHAHCLLSANHLPCGCRYHFAAALLQCDAGMGMWLKAAFSVSLDVYHVDVTGLDVESD